MTTQTNVRAMHAATRYTYTAWVVNQHTTECAPLDVAAAETLAEAASLAAPHCQHKAKFFVRQVDAVTGIAVVALYAVKARKVWRKCPATMITKQIEERFADEVTVFQVRAFDPVEPFRWMPGCDVVGHSGILEARA